MTHHSISTIIITLNEEASIERCIKSVLPISDEIIVLDSYSTDKTAEICANYTEVKFIQSEWLGYSQTKNKAASLALHQMIFSIDADECLDDEAIKHLLHLKKAGLTGAYQINRKNFFGNTWIKHGGWYPDVKRRLYDKSLCKWMGDFVHETLEVPDNLALKHIQGNILHYTVQNKEQHIQTIHKYAKLAAKREKAKGKRLTAFEAGLSTMSHFFKLYVLKLGFLDGTLGLSIALHSAKSKWLRYQYFRDLKT